MSVLFLTLNGLLEYARQEQLSDDSWLDTGLYFLDCDQDRLARHPEVYGLVRKAEGEGRVAWRTSPPSKNQHLLDQLLVNHNLAELNPNLPPIDDPSFLKIAVERVNNKNGLQRVQVIA